MGTAVNQYINNNNNEKKIQSTEQGRMLIANEMCLIDKTITV